MRIFAQELPHKSHTAHTSRLFFDSGDVNLVGGLCLKNPYNWKCTVFVFGHITHQMCETEACAVPKSKNTLFVASQQIMSVLWNFDACDLIFCQTNIEKWLELFLRLYIKNLNVSSWVAQEYHVSIFGIEKPYARNFTKVGLTFIFEDLLWDPRKLNYLKNTPLQIVQIFVEIREEGLCLNSLVLRLLFLVLIHLDKSSWRS